MIREKIQNLVRDAIGKLWPDFAIGEIVVEKPDDSKLGDYAVSVAFALAKQSKLPPAETAGVLVKELEKNKSIEIDRMESIGGYINFFLSLEFLKKELSGIYKKADSYGESNKGKGEKIIVEYSQPNIAKPLHAGHLRNTVLGDALANIYDFAGYKTIRWNYLGDWGTQFGKVIAAYKKWSNEEKVKADPIGELVNLYIRFDQEAKNDPELDKLGQEEFKKLESGDSGNRELWAWFKEESLRALEKTYDLLGIKFDVDIGESFYENMLPGLVERLIKDGIAETGEGGAIIINLEKYNLPPALIRKADGASLYLTRDIANLEYRLKKYKPYKILYVVGSEQALHFEQLFAIAEIIKLDSAVLKHIKYGLVLGEDKKKLSTRGGNAVTFQEIIDKTLELADKIVREKHPEMSEKDYQEISKVVGVGALKYTMLKDHTSTDIAFSWERMLDFNGNSGPYLQYTYARLASIIHKAEKIKKPDFGYLEKEIEFSIIKHLIEFPEIVKYSAGNYLTNYLATYLFELANLANQFYETTPVLKEENEGIRNARLGLIETINAIMKTGLSLLGIQVLDKI